MQKVFYLCLIIEKKLFYNQDWSVCQSVNDSIDVNLDMLHLCFWYDDSNITVMYNVESVSFMSYFRSKTFLKLGLVRPFMEFPIDLKLCIEYTLMHTFYLFILRIVKHFRPKKLITKKLHLVLCIFFGHFLRHFYAFYFTLLDFLSFMLNKSYHINYFIYFSKLKVFVSLKIDKTKYKMEFPLPIFICIEGHIFM